MRYLLTTLAALVLCVAACGNPSSSQSGSLGPDISTERIVVDFLVEMSVADIESFAASHGLKLVLKLYWPNSYVFAIDRTVIGWNIVASDIALDIRLEGDPRVANAFPISYLHSS